MMLRVRRLLPRQRRPTMLPGTVNHPVSVARRSGRKSFRLGRHRPHIENRGAFTKLFEDLIKFCLCQDRNRAPVVFDAAARAQSFLFYDAKSEKSLAHDDFVAVFKRLTMSGNQPMAAVHKRAIGRSKILNHVLTFA